MDGGTQVVPDSPYVGTSPNCSCLDGHPYFWSGQIKARDRILDDPSPTWKRTCGGKDDLARPIARRPGFLFGLGGHSSSSTRAMHLIELIHVRCPVCRNLM